MKLKFLMGVIAIACATGSHAAPIASGFDGDGGAFQFLGDSFNAATLSNLTGTLSFLNSMNTFSVDPGTVNVYLTNGISSLFSDTPVSPVVATDGGYTYTFSMNNVAAGDYKLWITGTVGTGNVIMMNTGTYSVTAVPEPETYAMMLAGLGALGFVARRRKAK